MVIGFLALPCPATELDDLIENGSYGVQLSDSHIAIASNLDTPLIPASIIKIATSYAAMEILGHDFHFKTSFFLTPGPDLWIKGGGDPLLVSEAIDAIVIALKAHGLVQIRDIYLDDSLFALQRNSVSISNSNNPYDAGLTSLGVNFTTIAVRVAPDKSISSDEEQTPLLPIMVELAHDLKPGRHRINVGRNPAHILRHTGELFVAKFAQHGIVCTGIIKQGQVPTTSQLFYQHSSPSLWSLVESMLLYSNNFTANLLYLACGLKEYGAPATWQKAEMTMTNFLTKNELFTDQPIIIDGAGLSPDNKVTARFMLNLLKAFRPYRLLLPRHEEWLIKSGTMTGVYSYAGYLGPQIDAPALVLILNQNNNNRDALLKRIVDQTKELTRK